MIWLMASPLQVKWEEYKYKSPTLGLLMNHDDWLAMVWFFLNVGQTGGLFLFIFFRFSTQWRLQYNIWLKMEKALIVCFGFEPGTSGW